MVRAKGLSARAASVDLPRAARVCVCVASFARVCVLLVWVCSGVWCDRVVCVSRRGRLGGSQPYDPCAYIRVCEASQECTATS
jgi:hypothetical protein